MEDIIREVILAAIVPLMASAVVAVRAWLKTTLTPQRLQAVSQLARVAVDAADEVGRAIDTVNGPEKYEYAERVLMQSAKRVGIKLTNEEANAFIHSVLNGKHDEIATAVEAVLDEILEPALDTDDEDGQEAA